MRILLSLAILILTGSAVAAQEKITIVEKIMIVVAEDSVDFLAGKELVGRYRFGKTFSKPIFWPLNAPGGIPVTRAWPIDKSKPGESADHPHQKSAWFCHGDVIPEGIELKHKIRGVEGVDFWSEAPGHGNIVCTRVGKPQMRGTYACIMTENEWQTADGTKIMDETRILHFHDFGKARLIVFDIDLLASVCPITFGDTKEGALGVRIKDDLRADKRGKGKIVNAEGKVNEEGCWGRISAWCDYSGPIDAKKNAKKVGLAIFCDPNNPLPSCWHSRGYGLMAANPFGRSRSLFPAVKDRTDLVRLAKGGHLRLRYAILLHEGDAETGMVADYYQRFLTLRREE
jgi:hypothetical protein